MAIVRHIVELHGGTVRVESAGADAGSRFIIALPLRATAGADRGEGVASGVPAVPVPDAAALVVKAGIIVLAVWLQRPSRV